MMDATATRSASPVCQMLESDQLYATKELLQITANRCVTFDLPTFLAEQLQQLSVELLHIFHEEVQLQHEHV